MPFPHEKSCLENCAFKILSPILFLLGIGVVATSPIWGPPTLIAQSIKRNNSKQLMDGLSTDIELLVNGSFLPGHPKRIEFEQNIQNGKIKFDNILRAVKILRHTKLNEKNTDVSNADLERFAGNLLAFAQFYNEYKSDLSQKYQNTKHDQRVEEIAKLRTSNPEKTRASKGLSYPERHIHVPFRTEDSRNVIRSSSHGNTFDNRQEINRLIENVVLSFDTLVKLSGNERNVISHPIMQRVLIEKKMSVDDAKAYTLEILDQIDERKSSDEIMKYLQEATTQSHYAKAMITMQLLGNTFALPYDVIRGVLDVLDTPEPAINALDYPAMTQAL